MYFILQHMLQYHSQSPDADVDLLLGPLQLLVLRAAHGHQSCWNLQEPMR